MCLHSRSVGFGEVIGEAGNIKPRLSWSPDCYPAAERNEG
jgi:hypothetical protein